MKISKLVLKENSICDFGALQLGICLQYNHTLTDVNMECNYISDKGFRSIFKTLHFNSTLTSLNIGKNLITDESFGCISNYWKQERSLKKFQYHNNQFTKDVIKKIEGILEKYM